MAEHLLHQLRQWIELSVQLVKLVLLILASAVEFLELLHSIFIHGLHHVQYLETLLDGDALASDETHVVLPILHAVHVFLQADLLLSPDCDPLNLDNSAILVRSKWIPSFKHLPKSS